MHDCIGSSCQFCSWRRHGNLFEDTTKATETVESTLYGIQLTKKFVSMPIFKTHTCFVCLCKLYNSKCPVHQPGNAFYLTPLSKSKADVWYSRVPLGHNRHSQVVPELIKKAGFEGYYTNHSLRVSLAINYLSLKLMNNLL